MEDRKDKNFEFTLRLNEHIIVQRLFNVFGFNQRAVNSMDFKYTVDDNVHLITSALKNKTLDFMSDNTEKYDENPSYDQNTNKDTFIFTIKMNGKEIVHREFTGNIYPSSVRYSVDIREHIYKIITSTQRVLCSKNDQLDLTYLNHRLDQVTA
jgi:hypothetical protein